MRKTVLSASWSILTLLWFAVWSTPAGAVPLQITGKSFNSPAFSGPGVVVDSGSEQQPSYGLTLSNVSERTITAWRLSCVYSESDGRSAISSLESDAFLQYEWQLDSPQPGQGAVAPGEVFDIVIPRPAETVISLYEALACQVDAVLFADGSQAGDPAAAKLLFDGRARLAADAEEAIGLLAALNPETLGEKSRAQVAFESALSRQGHSYAHLIPWTAGLSKAAAPHERSQQVDEILDRLREELRLIRKHLPRQ